MTARPVTAVRTSPPRLAARRVDARRAAAHLHLFTFVVGNALFWALWGAIAVSAERWYWWPLVPLAGWTLVLAAHLRHASRPPR